MNAGKLDVGMIFLELVVTVLLILIVSMDLHMTQIIGCCWVRILRRVDDSKMSSGISPPGEGNLSRRFEGAKVFIVKGGVPISDQSMTEDILDRMLFVWIKGTLCKNLI